MTPASSFQRARAYRPSLGKNIRNSYFSVNLNYLLTEKANGRQIYERGPSGRVGRASGVMNLWVPQPFTFS